MNEVLLPKMAKGIKTVYLLCLLLCVAEANFFDNILHALLGSGSDDQVSSGGSDSPANTPGKVIPKSDHMDPAAWKWTSSPAPSAPKSGPQVFDVTKFGATADGSKECTSAFLDAWKAACSYEGKSWFVVPEGEFLLGEIAFEGHCFNQISPAVEIRGTLKAVSDLSAYSDKYWITFRHLDGLVISGGGTLDGQGAYSWDQNDCNGKKDCNMLPYTLRLVSVSNALVGQINLVNSKAFHLHLTRSNNSHIYDLNITAPEDSPNTDGIHISSCNGIKITDSFIGVGDDCISIGDGNNDILISNVFGGPGHGISVGSLGKYEDEEPVTGIHVKNCTLTGTTNGIRIKTWPGSSTELLVSNLTFEDIVVNRVAFPIIIDQKYCPTGSCGDRPPSKVKISNILYKNFSGVSFTKLAVNLLCSADFPCENIQFSNIDIAYQDPGSNAASFCSHAKVVTSGIQNPPPCI